MSFEITYGTLRNPTFQSAYKKLMESTELPGVKAAYDVARLGKHLEKELKIALELFVKMFKSYVVHEKDKPVVEKDGWKLQEGVTPEKFAQEMKTFHEYRVTIERNKLDFKMLEKVTTLSPADIGALEEVMEMGEA